MSPRTYEEEPPVSDYRRSVSSYDANDGDRELTLSTPTILGLFFALAMVCACFFGLGYAMGHKTPVAAAAPQVFDAPTALANGAPKPAPGSATTGPDSAASLPDATATGPQTATVPLTAPLTASDSASATPAAPPAPTAGSAAPQSAPASMPSSAAKTTPATAVPPGDFVVQVAAVSSQDVATILLSTLQKKGYAVAVRHEPQDQLLHVQIGPFPDRKDAEAMRQRVLADGFNAIVK